MGAAVLNPAVSHSYQPPGEKKQYDGQDYNE
jgi:hypothetical protein